MDFNIAMCASLSTTYRRGKRVVLERRFHLGGQAIPAMEWEDRYKHLGVLLGPNPDSCLDKLAADYRQDTQRLLESGLADWMKLEAFKEFVVPKLGYAIRSTLAHKNWSLKLDKYIGQTVKQALGPPRRTCNAIFYVPTAKGGLGLRSIADELGNLLITQATKMLTSPDPLVWVISTHSLDCTILKRYGSTEGPEDRWHFLSGQLRQENEGRRGDISSVWSRMRSSVMAIGLRLHGGTAEFPAQTAVTIGEHDLSGRRLRGALLEAAVGEGGVLARTVDGVGRTGRAGWIIQPGIRVQLLDQGVPLPARQGVSLGRISSLLQATRGSTVDRQWIPGAGGAREHWRRRSTA